MDCLVRFYSTCPVPERIFNFLDPRSLCNCRLVSSHWKECMDSLKCWHRSKLESFEKKRLFKNEKDVDEESYKIVTFFRGEKLLCIYEKFPRWEQLMFHFKFNTKIKDLRDFANYMTTYFEKGDKSLNPLHDAILTENMPFIFLLLQTPWDFFGRDENGLNPLHFASQHNKNEILMLLLDVAKERRIDINIESGNLIQLCLSFLCICIFNF